MEEQNASNAEVGSYDSSQILMTEAPPTEVSVETITGEQEVVTQPVYDPNSITQVPEIQTEQEVSVSESQEPAKDDPNRIAYWQSQSDLHKNDSQRLAEENTMYKNMVSKIMNDQQQNGIPAEPQKQQDPLNQPAQPTSYNEVDAYNDPESDSFRYRLAKEDYQNSRVDQLLNTMQQQEAVRQQDAVNQRDAMVVNQAFSHVKNGYGWDQNKSSEFVQWAQNPNNVTVDILAKVFEMQNAPNTATVQAQNKANELRQAGERLQVPRTTAVTTGQAEPQFTDQDSFNAGLLSHSRVRK
jgi:hypothetical protein